DGFIDQARSAKTDCARAVDPACGGAVDPDVLGYHTRSDIPNYWRYAKDFVLQDHMFEPNASWSLPAHLFMVSEWSARCTTHDDPGSCVNDSESPAKPLGTRPNGQLSPRAGIYAWTDLTYLLHRQGVSWGYYVTKGAEPDCDDDAAVTCDPVPQ